MFKGIFASVSLLLAFSAMQAVSGAVTTKPVTVSNKDPRIYYHGRWDDSPGTWWCVHPGLFQVHRFLTQLILTRAGSGFKLHVKNLKSLTLNLGNHTTTPFAAVGVSVNYGEFVTFNVSEGANPISLGASASHHGSDSTSVVRVNVEGWQNNRINLKSIVLNSVREHPPFEIKVHANPVRLRAWSSRVPVSRPTNPPNSRSNSSATLFLRLVLFRVCAMHIIDNSC